MNDMALSLKIGASLKGGFKSVFSSAKSEVKGLETATKRVGSSLGAIYKAQDKRNKEVGGASLGGTAGILGAAYAFAQPIKQAIQFETAMLGVAKQVDGARDATGKLTPVYTGMRKEIQMLGREIPIATNELAAMVEAGAKMGVAKNDLMGFTRQTSIMATAFNLPAAQLADDVGKIANLYKIPIAAIGQLGDTINYLGDQTLSDEGGIVNFLTRVGGVAASVKITGNNMAALGSTLLSLGETTDTASTATNAIFQKFAAAKSGTKPFREAMDALGLSLSDVQKGMQVDAQGTLLEVLDAINAMPADQRLGILSDLVGLEHSDTLAKLATGVAEYRNQIALAGSDKAKGSMSKDFAAQLATTEKQLQLLSNQTLEVGVKFGSVFLPKLQSVIQPMATVANFAGDMVEKFPIIGDIIGGVAIGIGAYATAVGLAAISQWGLNAALTANPFGIIVGAVALAATAIYTNWAPISQWVGDNVFQPIENKANQLKAVIESIGKAWNFVKGIGSAISGAFSAPANASMRPVGATAGQSAKTGFLGPVPAKSLPDLSGALTSSKSSSVITNANTFHITQLPGENSEAFAKRILDMQDRRQKADQRRALHD